MEAFNLAIEQGADGIELDVQLTRDDQLIVMHDETLERTTDGHGWVADAAWSDLEGLDASMGREGFEGCRIPLLGEVLELLAPTDLTLNIELKTDLLPYKGIVDRVMACVDGSGMADRVLYSSFNHYTLMQLRQAGASQPLGALLSDRLFKPWRYASDLDVDAIHPASRAATPKMVSKSHERGMDVNVWTVDAPRDIRKHLARGVDAIITNQPARALRIRDAVDGLGATDEETDNVGSEPMDAPETTDPTTEDA